MLVFPNNDVVQGDGDGQAEDCEGHQSNVGGDLGRVGGGQGHGRYGAGRDGDRLAGAGGAVHLVSVRTGSPAGTLTGGLVPDPAAQETLLHIPHTQTGSIS